MHIDPQSEPDRAADIAMELLGEAKPGDAIELLERVVGLQPNIDRYRYRLGLAYASVGSVDRAEKEILAAINLNPRFGVFHHGLIRLLAPEGAERLAEAYGGRDRLARLPNELQIFAIRCLADAGIPFTSMGPLLGAFGSRCGGIKEGGAGVPKGLVRLTCRQGRFFLELSEAVAGNGMLLDRLMNYSLYLDKLADLEVGPPRSALLALDDSPPDDAPPAMCFSSRRRDDVLVPDSAFVQSQGYADFRSVALAQRIKWSRRVDTAYWRGVLTGVATTFEGVVNLPRVRLSKLQHSRLNAKITDTAQYAHYEPMLSEWLDSRACLGPQEAATENLRYRYLVDIDGNSNSWSGLYIKMIAGGCVLKIASPYRQWFYDRMRPGVDYVHVEDLERDLELHLSRIAARDSGAQKMGEAARKLALSMTIESEFSSLLAGWRALCV